MKQCTKCRERKPLDEFWRKSRSKDGRDGQCSSCRKAWYAENSDLHKARVWARNKRYRQELYALLTAYLFDHPCVDCGESDIRCLEFDHRPEEEKFQEVARMVGSSMPWHRILAEIDKCDVRCSNCHRRRTGERRGFWREQVHQDREAKLHERAVRRLSSLMCNNLP